jgi:tRNA dimethylallyltransferase
MVDVEDVAHDYSVQRFQSDARACIDELLEHGLTPVLAGGTGLYLNAVIDEMQFPAGKLGDERRTHYEDYAREKGPDALYALLAERDPKSAELIHPNNTKRVVRALEMLDEGVSYAEHHAGLSKRAPHYEAHIWGLTMERSRLYQRIDERVDEMFSAGLVDEVRLLRGQGLSREHTAGQAIGYKEILDALDGTCTIDEARAAIKLRTRRYAKRQLSWFRHDERVQWINLDYASLDEAAEVVLRDARDSREGVGAHESL